MCDTPYNFSFHTAKLVELLTEHGLTKGHSPNCNTLEIKALTTDSRNVTSESAFIAYRGIHHDAHKYLSQLVANKPRLLIIEDLTALPRECETPWIHVSDARSAWAWASALGYGMPQEKLRFVGITGTNGKTSCVWMLRQMFLQHGIKALSLGTLGTYFGEEKIESTHTTPDPPQLYLSLKKAVERGYSHVVMEVSSHALAHGRVAPIKFNTAGFTNFSRDHLDFHGSLEAYWQAKWLMFQKHLAPKARCIFHTSLMERIDSDFNHQDLWFYGSSKAQIHPRANFVEVISKGQAAASHLIVHEDNSLKEFRGNISFLGDHAKENFALALIAFHHETSRWLSGEAWSNLAQIPGRLEAVGNDSSQPLVLVDYAHTPDALEKALSSCRQLTRGRLICVFGCGGERDAGKRPQMGAAGAKLSDEVIVTSDNPRSEDPKKIIEEILSGISSTTSHRAIEDRRQAIFEAIFQAQKDDVVLIAGKGHENYQLIGDKVLSFDDRLVAMEALEKRER